MSTNSDPHEPTEAPQPASHATPPMADEPMVTDTEHAGADHAEAEHSDAPAPHDPGDDHVTARPKRDPLPVLFGIGVLVLIGAVVFLWRHPINLASFSSQPAAPPASATMAANTPSATTPAASVTAPPASAPPVPGEAPAPEKPQAPAAAEKAPPPADAAASPPPPPPPAAVAAADPPPASSPAPASSSAPPVPAPQTPGDGAIAGRLGDLQHRIDTLDAQVKQLGQSPPPPDLGPLDKRLTAIENRPAPPDPSAAIATLGNRLDALGTKLDALAAGEAQLAARQGSDSAALGGRLDTADAKIDAVAKQAAGLASLSDRAARIARIQAASAALTAGQALGDIPGATPPLEKFRTAPPPTEASLRLSFPAAAKAAGSAGQPDSGKLAFWQAVQDRAEHLVTVRRGDEVLVGDSTAGVIARARTALDAGDLAGAVAAVGSLTGPPAQAMAEWTGQARALLDARAALAALAARA